MVTNKIRIDINADLGEGAGHDTAIMPLISSCNIACGGHYGDKSTVLETLALAKKYGVKVGAHPSFPDKENFGRKIIDISPTRLVESLVNQVKEFLDCCKTLDVKINHIKPHGALYNYSAHDANTYKALLAMNNALDLNCPIYALPGSLLAKDTSCKIPIVLEAFLDRTYTDQGTLVNRNKANALITTNEQAWLQLKHLVLEQVVISENGKRVAVNADTFCIHGDTPTAINMLRYIHKQLPQANIILDQ